MLPIASQFRSRRVGCGIAVRGNGLVAVAVRVRPGGVEVLGQLELRDFRERPPDQSGAEYSGFLRDLGLGRMAATFCVPRDELTFRVLRMPSMRSKELARAVALRVDEVHPYGEADVMHAFAPLGGGPEEALGQPVAVAVARSDRLLRYADAFARAEIDVARYTVSPSAIRAAIRYSPDGCERPFALVLRSASQLEIYGESESRPCLSSSLDLAGISFPGALRLAFEALGVGGGETARLALLGTEGLGNETHGFVPCAADSILRPIVRSPRGFSLAKHALAFGAAVESARPRSRLGIDLLPAAPRRSGSGAPFARRMALGAGLALLGAAALVRPVVQDRKYADRLKMETAALQAAGEASPSGPADAAGQRRRRDWLLERQGRTRSDLELLREIADSMPASAAIRALEAGDSALAIAGSAEDAGAVLRSLTSSPMLDGARFAGSPTISADGELFRIEARRR